jgi:hypothetical protein
MNEQLRPIVARVMTLLADQDYYALELLTRGHQLSAKDIETAITTYGRTLVPPPEVVYSLMDVVRVEVAEDRWAIAIPVWTIEEGRSDLSVELTIEFSNGAPEVSLEGIHVL